MSNETKEIIVLKRDLPSTWDNEKWEQVKKMFVPKGVSEEDAMLFIELSKVYELNPLKRELWIIPYGNKAQVFAGRDGFLAIAHKSGMFDGMHTEFGYRNGKLDWAETTVWNKSCTHPIKCKVFFSEYTTGKNLWLTKPHVMLQKVAESTALRRAFNINGLYCPEEFEQSTSIKEEPRAEINQTQEEPKPETKAEEPKDKRAEMPEEEAFNNALKVLDDRKCESIDRLILVKGRIDARNWEDMNKKKLLDDNIIKTFERIINDYTPGAALSAKITKLINCDWLPEHKDIIAQLALVPAKESLEQFFKEEK